MESVKDKKRCRQTAFYTPTFCNRVVTVMKREDLCKHVTQELKDGMNLFGDMNMHDHEGVEEAFSMSPDRKTSVVESMPLRDIAVGNI